MAPSTHFTLAGLLFFLPRALTSLFSRRSNNIAIYWGQNSYSSDSSQQRLSYYCANNNIDIIALAFLNGIKDTNINFANAEGNCTLFPGTTLLDCPQISEDIQTCQAMGKTIVLSIGGDTYTEGGFDSSAEAITWADIVWAMFGPGESSTSVNRPFRSAVVDGFDLNFESPTSNAATFATRLRVNMDSATAAGDKKYYLSVAPQCPYPDIPTNDILAVTELDYVMVQFYNNVCGVSSFVPGRLTQQDFTFSIWDTWAHNVSKNRNTKIFLGVLGNTGSGAGYVSGYRLSRAISFSKAFDSFGGVMIWDMSQVYNNPEFLSAVASDLGRPTTLLASASSKTILAASMPTSELICGK